MHQDRAVRRYGPHNPDTRGRPKDDAAPARGAKSPDRRIRAPPVERQSMSIKEFCAAHRISLRCFYNLIEDGTAPATFRVGRCVRISVEAAEAWMARQEAANAAMNITTNVVT